MPSSRLSGGTALSSALLHNLLIFGRLLRQIGLKVTSGSLIEVAGSLTLVDLRNKEDFRNAVRCVFVKRHEDLESFDRAFELFWREVAPSFDTGLLSDMSNLSPALHRAQPPPASSRNDRRSNAQTTFGREVSAPGSSPADEYVSDRSVTYSSAEILRTKDFSSLNRAELEDARRFLDEMRWTITQRRSLRIRPARAGSALDIRRSVRRNLRYGGELLDLAYSRPKMKRRRLVLLCDISGSMDRYTRLFLHFLHSIESSRQRAEVFVFGTRLTRITAALRRRDPDSAIATVISQVQDWSGGTRIGDSLSVFNRRWARRVLEHGAIVIVISDGWDRGDPALLSAEIQRLQRASYRLLWLNPLLGAVNYQPLTQGMRAALPFVDDFLPVHNLASLQALATLLNEVQDIRPTRTRIPARPARGEG
ncbi:MAG: vWA domain-containing protein [Dehalococcoidia bacterium]